MNCDSLCILIPAHSLEDFPTELGDRPAEGLLNGWAALWHPRLLAAAGDIPHWHRGDDPPEVRAGGFVVVPPACDSMVPSAWIERARREGMHVVNGLSARGPLLQALLAPLGESSSVSLDLEADFLAFGHVHLQTEILTRHMRQFGNLEEERLRGDAVAAAKAAVAGDEPAARTHLKHCFEQLLEARERFYPVSCFLMDLCLVIPSLAGTPLAKLLGDVTPVNLMATAEDLRSIVQGDASLGAAIRERWQAETLEVVGGEWAERCSTLLPLNATLYELERGRRELRELFGRTPATWGRRRYGLSPHLPQILKRCGYAGALHFVLDDGIYPDEEFSKLLWQGADGSSIPAFSRIPLAGDSASAFLRFPVRMAESMDHDHVAGLAFARWPELKSPWLEDFRRAHRYAPVLGDFVTFEKFFGESDLDGRMSEFRRGGYLSPFLVQAVARREPRPVSRYVDDLRRRRTWQAVEWSLALQSLLAGAAVPQAESPLEAALADAGPDVKKEPAEPQHDSIELRLTASQHEAAAALAETLLQGAPQQRGLLVVNSLSFGRTAVVDWPADWHMPAPEPPILARDFDASPRQVVVSLPPCGFVWIPAPATPPERPPAGKVPMAEELLVRNEFMEIALSDVTGGISQVRRYDRGGNRLSQQLGWRFPREKSIPGVDTEGQPRRTWYSEMRLRETRVLADGPARGAVETVGELIDPSNGELLATYRQTVTLWRGRPYADVEVELGVEKAPEGDPWTNYIGVRFAWSDSSEVITRSMQETAHTVKDEQRVESPDYLELASDSQRTTILTGGLPFHRMTGPRMLDTLLVTEGESARRFRFAIAVNESYPMEAALGWETPAPSVPVEHGPPRSGPSGWLFRVESRNVQLQRVMPLRSEESRGAAGCVVRLQETEGRNRSFRVGCFRPATKARQVDFDGNVLHTFQIEEGAARVSIAPCEICDVELLF